MTMLTEAELRNEMKRDVSLTLNVPFLQEIKEDNVPFRQTIDRVNDLVDRGDSIEPRELSEGLESLRDMLEIHFALEEFYGYFGDAQIDYQDVGHRAEGLRDQHIRLFNEISELVEQAMQFVYHESSAVDSVTQIVHGYRQFSDHLEQHERDEMELMMRLCNDDIGVGD